MAAPLIIDNKALSALKKYAEENRFCIYDVRRMVAGEIPCAGDREEHVCFLPVDFKVVLSIEEHPLKDGSGTAWLRHMSMSINRKGRVPNPAGVEMVAKELGFPPFKDCYVNFEKDCDPPYVEVIYQEA